MAERDFDGRFIDAWRDGFRIARVESFEWMLRKLDRCRSIRDARKMARDEFRRTFPAEFAEARTKSDLMHVLAEDAN